MVVKREIECQLPVMGPFYEMIANVYAQGWVELLLTRFQWIFFFADALDSLCLAKDLCRYGGNTQICQLQGRGTQNPYSFTETKYFLIVL